MEPSVEQFTDSSTARFCPSSVVEHPAEYVPWLYDMYA